MKRGTAAQAFLNDPSIPLISSISIQIANSGCSEKEMIYSKFLNIGSRAILCFPKKKSKEVHLWTSKSLTHLYWGSFDKLKIFGSISISSIKGIYAGCLDAKNLYNSFTIESSEETLQVEICSLELSDMWSESLKYVTSAEFAQLRASSDSSDSSTIISRSSLSASPNRNSKESI